MVLHIKSLTHMKILLLCIRHTHTHTHTFLQHGDNITNKIVLFMVSINLETSSFNLPKSLPATVVLIVSFHDDKEKENKGEKMSLNGLMVVTITSSFFIPKAGCFSS